ncbi:MAG: T9SS type A sorting domain-containing protein [Bacteroidia bacterium]
MKRKDFLKGMGALGIGSLLPLQKAAAAATGLSRASFKNAGSCILIPQETAGPFPWAMGLTPFFRQDVREGNAGVQLNLTLTVVNINNNCAPIPNARVDIWQCDKDGNYSEYGTFAGQSFFRGYQFTDVNGQVNFITIYPGWYPGRVTHIHFQVFLNSVLSATSQMAFQDSLTTAVYANNSLIYINGQNAVTNATDGVFADAANTQYELLTVVANGSGGYDGSLIVGMNVPLTGVINLEPETGGQFKLMQNYPNPFLSITTIPFVLHKGSRVTIEIYNMQGKKVLNLINENMSAGEQKVVLSKKTNGSTLAAGTYMYQLTVENEKGTFHQCKVLTLN